MKTYQITAAIITVSLTLFAYQNCSEGFNSRLVGSATESHSTQDPTPTPDPIVTPTPDPVVAPPPPTSLPSDLIQKSDLEYVGAFRVPQGSSDTATFAYGGTALGLGVNGRSLFMTGHDWHLL